MNPCTTLIVIPCYNDAERLSRFLPELVQGLPDRFRVLVSDDGSNIAERNVVQELVNRMGGDASRRCRVDLVFSETNTGKGGAIMRGWANNDSENMLGFVDADGAVGVAEILRAEKWLAHRSEIDALVGSRVKMLGRHVERSLKRHLSGRIFATLVSEISGVPVYDSQCGLKLLRKDAYLRVAPHLKTKGFAFDVELLLCLIKFGCRTVEFPVDWRDVPGSKVSLLRDSLGMAGEVFKICKRIDSIKLS